MPKKRRSFMPPKRQAKKQTTTESRKSTLDNTSTTNRAISPDGLSFSSDDDDIDDAYIPISNNPTGKNGRTRKSRPLSVILNTSTSRKPQHIHESFETLSNDISKSPKQQQSRNIPTKIRSTTQLQPAEQEVITTEKTDYNLSELSNSPPPTQEIIVPSSRPTNSMPSFETERRGIPHGRSNGALSHGTRENQETISNDEDEIMTNTRINSEGFDVEELNEWKVKYESLLRLRQTEAEKSLEDYMKETKAQDSILGTIQQSQQDLRNQENQKWTELFENMEGLKKLLLQNKETPDVLSSIQEMSVDNSEKVIDALKQEIRDLKSELQDFPRIQSQQLTEVATVAATSAVTEATNTTVELVDEFKADIEFLRKDILRQQQVNEKDKETTNNDIKSLVDTLKKDLQTLRKELNGPNLSQNSSHNAGLDTLKKEIKQLTSEIHQMTGGTQSVNPSQSVDLEMKNTITLISSLCGISIEDIEDSEDKTIYICRQQGRYGQLHYSLEISKITSSQSKKRMSQVNENDYEVRNSYSIFYSPFDNEENELILNKLPPYFKESLEFENNAAGPFFWKITEALNTKR